MPFYSIYRQKSRFHNVKRKKLVLGGIPWIKMDNDNSNEQEHIEKQEKEMRKNKLINYIICREKNVPNTRY